MDLIVLFETLHIRQLLFLSAVTTIAGDYFGKVWSINRQPSTFLLAFILYASGGLFFITSFAV